MPNPLEAVERLEALFAPHRDVVTGSILIGVEHIRPILALISTLRSQAEALEKALDALQRLHTDIDALMAGSSGVYGLHHNGDLSPWEELQQGGQFEDWLGVPLWAARNAWTDGRNVMARAALTPEVKP